MKSRDLSFLDQRRKVTRWEAFAAAFMLATILALVAVLWFWFPGWIHPGYVADQLEAGAMSRSLLETTAIIYPVLVWMILGLLLFLVFLCYALFVMERKYLGILERLLAGIAESGANPQLEPHCPQDVQDV